MFGLTKREQRWKAEQQAAEVLAELAKTVVQARAKVAVAEAQTSADELARLRAENAAQREELDRTWYVLKDFGAHPGRTDDRLADCVRAALTAKA